MHGHTLDAMGQKMSKSLGNFVSPDDVIRRFGRDALRLYELQRTVWEDFRFSWDAVEEASSTLKVAWNVLAFASLYMNLDSFNPNKWRPEKVARDMRQEDKWLLSKTENLKATVTNALETFEIHTAARALNNFMLDDLSHWYVRLVRRRFWQERESRDKMATYAALYNALRNWLVLSSPIIPFITEKLYQTMIRPVEKRSLESIHMSDWPKLESRWWDENLEVEMEIMKDVVSAVAAARQSLKIKMRQPVQKTIVVTNNPQVKKAIKRLDKLVHEQANTRKIEFLSVDEEKKLEKIVAAPRYDALGPNFKAETQAIANVIKSAEGRTILDNLRKSGFHLIDIEGRQVKILPSMVSFREEMPKGYASGTFSQGRVYVEAALPKSLVEEGLVRDVVRRLQEMRRRMDLPVDRFVEVYVVCPTKGEANGLKRRHPYIQEEVRARHLELKSATEKPTIKAELEEIWTINGKTYKMGMRLAKGKKMI
jgi:isoleucyl-tRNA synthetase